MSPQAVTLIAHECWDALRSEEFGRLAYSLDGEVHIVPINYAVDGTRLVFRTAAGSKMKAVMEGGQVAFEIDSFEGEWAQSIVVRGHLSEMTGSEAQFADQLPLRPWLDTHKPHVCAITAYTITGRRYRMHRPWHTMTPQV